MSRLPIHTEISERNADEFLRSLEDTFASMEGVEVEDLYLSSTVRDGVPVSYDESLEPFVGQTRGYNPPELRIELDEDLFVLRKVQEALERVEKRGKGARVFLTSTRAYYVEGSEERTLVTWEWPGKDLVEEVAGLSE